MRRKLMAFLFCVGWLLMLVSGLRAVEPPKPVDPMARLQMALVEKDAEIAQLRAELLRLRACSEAGIKHTECRLDWQAGTVGKIEPPKPEPAKKQAP